MYYLVSKDISILLKLNYEQFEMNEYFQNHLLIFVIFRFSLTKNLICSSSFLKHPLISLWWFAIMLMMLLLSFSRSPLLWFFLTTSLIPLLILKTRIWNTIIVTPHVLSIISHIVEDSLTSFLTLSLITSPVPFTLESLW